MTGTTKYMYIYLQTSDKPTLSVAYIMCTLHLTYLEFRRNSNNSICTSNLNKLVTPLEKINEDWIAI